MRLVICSLAIAITFLLVSIGGAQTTATTDPAGFTTTSCLSNSDTFVSLPFTRAPEFVGAVQSVTTNTITVPGTPWTANQFVYGGSQHNHYYALIGSGSATNPKDGHIYNITATPDRR